MGREEFAMNVMKKNRKVQDKSDMEMFALSGTDSDDSDVDVPQVNKKKIKNSKALVKFSFFLCIFYAWSGHNIPTIVPR